MDKAPWLSIIGLGEDGPEGLTPASRSALEAAEVVMGPARHLDLVPDAGRERIVWPVPFSDGIKVLQGLAVRRVAVLASGDPFWFGAGSVIARNFEAAEWQAFPGPSCFALMAARFGIGLEHLRCVALHAAPFETLRALLGNVPNIMVTLRDGAAVHGLATYLCDVGAGGSTLNICTHLGGPKEEITRVLASDVVPDMVFGHPVCAMIEVDFAREKALSLATGKPNDLFENDGQITKQPVRALTLSALAPRDGEVLWDIGGGSGSISIEWLLAGQTTRAICFEKHPERAERIRANAARLGVASRLDVRLGDAADVLGSVETAPDAIFIGGGLSADLLDLLKGKQAGGTRLVVNAVTLESEAVLIQAQAQLGGTLMRIELSDAAPLGPRLGWKASYPIVQWSVVL